MNYKLAYRVGFHPWEEAADDTAFVEQLGEIAGREENGNGRPYGAALDLGTGSGIWGIQLALRGWRVTGVDNSAKALRRAEARVRDAGVDMTLVNGDVTRLREAGVGSGYRLLLDTGTFHGLKRAQREAMGREIEAIAADDATVVLLAWAPRNRGPLPRGVSRDEVEAAFPRWHVTSHEPAAYDPMPKVLEIVGADEHWYTLRRR